MGTVKKMICIRGVRLGDSHHRFPSSMPSTPILIEGKVYDVILTQKKYKVMTEQGIEIHLPSNRFMDIDKWREIQLNKIGLQ